MQLVYGSQYVWLDSAMSDPSDSISFYNGLTVVITQNGKKQSHALEIQDMIFSATCDIIDVIILTQKMSYHSPTKLTVTIEILSCPDV